VGFTSLGDGETRFIESGPVTSQLQEVLHLFDLVVGTEEEFHIAGGSTDTLTALKNVRNATKATLVCKRGPMGCVVLEGDIPTAGTGAAAAGRARGGAQRAGRGRCLYVRPAARLA
jgi:sugar/nucleoside kinase (ribokinase family)